MADPQIEALVATRSVDCGLCGFTTERVFVVACMELVEHVMTCHPSEYMAQFPAVHIEEDLANVRLILSGGQHWKNR